MKFDKQTMIKHQFWILLGTFGVLALVLLILVPVIIGADVEDKKKKISDMKGAVETAGRDVKSRHFIGVQDDQKKVLGTKKTELWVDMYAKQKNIVSWPGDMHYTMGKKYPDFGQEIAPNDRYAYTSENVYTREYEDLAAMIKPTEYKGGWKNVLAPISWSEVNKATSDEVWLSLEDMCIRHEILNAIRQTNDAPAAFEIVPVGKGEALPQTAMGPKFAQRFQSRWYQIDLALDRKDRDYVVRGKIKNISGRRQSIYQMELRIWVSPNPSETELARPITLLIPIEALAADQVWEIKDQKININQLPIGLLRMEQGLNRTSVPIKRLSELVIGKNPGHRKYDPALKTAKAFQKETDTKPASTDPNNPGVGFSGKPGGIPATGDPRGMGGLLGDPNANKEGGEVTPNGLSKKRYIDVTDQIRRLPITVVMTIDQTSIPDIMAAFSNSRLRYQITQVHWTRVYSLPNTGTETPSSAPPISPGGPERPAGSGGIFTGGMPGKPTGSAPAGAALSPVTPPGFAAGGAGAEQSLGSEQQTANLVELTIYGVATLYERPKDSSGATLTPGTTPTATTPSTTTPPASSTTPPATTPMNTTPMSPSTPAPMNPANTTPMTPKAEENPKPMTPAPMATPPETAPKPSPADAPKPPKDPATPDKKDATAPDKKDPAADKKEPATPDKKDATAPAKKEPEKKAPEKPDTNKKP
jgi:hypothetical protein